MARNGFKSKSVSDEVSDKIDQVIAAYADKFGPTLSVSQILLIVLSHYEKTVIKLDA